MNELQQYFEAGYNLAFSETPAYRSSPVYMAFMSGVWAKKHFVPCGEIKAGRGYKMIVNSTYILDWKDSDVTPKVSQK